MGRFDLLVVCLQHAALHERSQHHKIRRWTLSRTAVERETPVQGHHPRCRSHPLHRADRAVGNSVLVAIRSAILHHLVVTFSVLFTFTDFQLIWVMTRGGPVNATHLMATFSYQRAIMSGYLGEGA